MMSGGLYGDVIPAEKFVAGFQACLDSVEVRTTTFIYFICVCMRM